MTTRAQAWLVGSAALLLACAGAVMSGPSATAVTPAPSVSEYTAVPGYPDPDRSVTITPSPIRIDSGGTLTISAAPPLWTRGPQGDRELGAPVAVLRVTHVNNGQFELPLSASVNADGSLLSLTVPSDLTARLPTWWPEGYAQVSVVFPDTGESAEQGLHATGAAQLNLTPEKPEQPERPELPEVPTTPEIPAPPREPGQPSSPAPAPDPAPGGQAPLPVAPPVPQPAARHLTAEADAVVTAGTQAAVTGSGFGPGEHIEVWLNSVPLLLATGVADERGGFAQPVDVPSDVSRGVHRLELRGLQSGSAFSAITVKTATASATQAVASQPLVRTGSDASAAVPVGTLLLGIGACCIAAGILLRARRDDDRLTPDPRPSP